MKVLKAITLALVIIGGLNWGLVGIAKFDLVATIFGAGSTLANIVYLLVGISAIAQVVLAITPALQPTPSAVRH